MARVLDCRPAPVREGGGELRGLGRTEDIALGATDDENGTGDRFNLQLLQPLLDGSEALRRQRASVVLPGQAAIRQPAQVVAEAQPPEARIAGGGGGLESGGGGFGGAPARGGAGEGAGPPRPPPPGGPPHVR